MWFVIAMTIASATLLLTSFFISWPRPISEYFTGGTAPLSDEGVEEQVQAESVADWLERNRE